MLIHIWTISNPVIPQNMVLRAVYEPASLFIDLNKFLRNPYVAAVLSFVFTSKFFFK